VNKTFEKRKFDILTSRVLLLSVTGDIG